MALKAGVFGLSAGSSWLTGGPDRAFVVKSVPFSSYCGAPLLCSPGQPGNCSDIKWFVDQCLNVVEVQGPVPGPVRCACTQRRSPTYMAPSTASSHSKGAQNTAKYPSSFFPLKLHQNFVPLSYVKKVFPLLFSCLNSSRLISLLFCS